MAQPQPWAIRAERGAYVRHLQAQRVASREIATILMAAARDAERTVLRLVDGSVSSSIQRAQLQAVNAEMRVYAANVFQATDQATRNGIAAATRAAAEGQEELMRILATAGADARLGTQFALRARASADVVRGKVMNNVQLSQRVYRNQTAMVNRAHRTVSVGLAQGRSAKHIAQNVRRFISPHTPGGASFAAMRLARTEINNAFHAVSSEMYNENPFVEGVKWEISGSHPRPDECDDYADQDHEGLGEGVFTPPNLPFKPHPQCLCYTVAVTVTPEKFRDMVSKGQAGGWGAALAGAG